MVCGGTAMGTAVQAAVMRAKAAALVRGGQGEAAAQAEAAKWMEQLVAEGRYVQELWS